MFQWTLDQKNIAIQVHAASCILPFHVEGIQQAISNLLDNAIIYYEGIGPIVLTGEVQDSHYKISVSGPGEPILGPEQENVVKRFYRLDSSRSRATGGSGLGLAITKKIVEQHHHGEIGVEITFDSNNFWIVLPRVDNRYKSNRLVHHTNRFYYSYRTTAGPTNTSGFFPITKS